MSGARAAARALDQTDQRQAQPLRGRQGELRFADASGSFDQDRFRQVLGDEDRGRDPARGNIADAAEAFRNGLDGGQFLVERVL